MQCLQICLQSAKALQALTLHELETGSDWTLLILTSTPRIRHQHTVATHACIFLEGVIGDNDAVRALKCVEGIRLSHGIAIMMTSTKARVTTRDSRYLFLSQISKY